MKNYQQLKKDRIEYIRQIKKSAKAHQNNDSVAKSTKWDLMDASTSNFISKSFIKTSSNLYYYRASLLSKIFVAAFIIVGVIALISGLFMISTSDKDGVLAFVIGLIGAIIGFNASREFNETIHFNKLSRTVLIKNNVSKFFKLNKIEQLTINFNDIHALQVLSERIRSNHTNYTNYQLNFVLKNASRHHLSNDPNSSRIFDAANALSKLIDIPIWNIT